MPGRDGTGPIGQGPFTGRAAGTCGDAARPVVRTGRGFGAGFGRGRATASRLAGWRHCFFATGVPGWMRFGEKQALQHQAEALQSELDLIRERLKDIEAGNDEK
jgi:hypothetical protein